jgi:hypothetical protein
MCDNIEWSKTGLNGDLEEEKESGKNKLLET